MARGHRVETIPEVPLVVADSELSGISKTKDAIRLLKAVGAYADIERVKDSRHIRPGKGKARGRRYVQKKGPLIIHNKTAEGGRKAPEIVTAFRNIPGIELCHVSRLNLLQLAPGGHVGRFIVWTEGAFKSVDDIFGTRKRDSKQKLGYRPPMPLLTNADIGRIINSEEVQSALRPRKPRARRVGPKKNPLKNLGVMIKLNPYAFAQRRRRVAASAPKPPAPKGGVKKPVTQRSQKKHKNPRTQFFFKGFANPNHCPCTL